MSPRTIVRLAAAAGCCLLLPIAGLAAKRAEKPADTVPTAEVLRVLRAEVAGVVNRRDSLKNTLPSESSAVARWQAGYVHDGFGWRSFDVAAVSTGSGERLSDYQALRSTTEASYDGRIELAEWCRQNELPDQELAHLHAALEADPERDHSALLWRLGYRPFGGQWLSPEQLRDWQALNRKTAASLEEWGTRLERIAKLLSGPARKQQTGQDALRDIKDASAIPAIELVLAGRSEPVARQAVAAIARFDGFEATTALARQGLFSNWDSVRQAAAAALQGRRFEEFVPPVVSHLSTPIKAELRVGQLPLPALGNRASILNSALVYNVVLTRETSNQFQVATFNTISVLVDGSAAGQGGAGTSGASSRSLVDPRELSRAVSDSQRAVADRLKLQEVNVERENTAIAELNERISRLLAVATGEAPSTDASTWWNWWNSWNEMEGGGSKAVVHVENQTEFIQTQLIGPPSFDGIPAAPRQGGGECFAAGTPVWTEGGLLSIEKIQIGDRVLSKDVETGELAYKPVLQTTIRPPKPLTALRLESETIVCTGGHRFWQSGAGWVKARDIESQSLFHTATGNTPVFSARKAQAAETYNLVVADFHTYFVGKTALLSHDVLLPRSTNKVVPGFDREQIAK